MKTLLRCSFLLIVLCIAFGGTTLLGDCINQPRFPGEFAGALIALFVLVGCTCLIFHHYITLWFKGKHEDPSQPQ